MIELILGGIYGMGLFAMYSAIADLAKDNKRLVTMWDRVKLALLSLLWPYMILYFAFYMFADYVTERRL